MGDIKIGCCGFPTAQHRYFETFKVLEVQKTFYEPPRMSTAKRWREKAPSGFEFTVKAWQLITHEPSSPTYRRLRREVPPEKRDRYGSFRLTPEVIGAWERTREVAEALGARIVVFQCPASFRPSDENLDRMKEFFGAIKGRKFTFAWEPRGAWDAQRVAGLCRELDLVHCVDPFKNEPVHGRIRYFRLHGRGGYRYSYTEEDLVALQQQCAGTQTCYCMFNNVSMLNDALAFRALVEANHPC